MKAFFSTSFVRLSLLRCLFAASSLSSHNSVSLPFLFPDELSLLVSVTACSYVLEPLSFYLLWCVRHSHLSHDLQLHLLLPLLLHIVTTRCVEFLCHQKQASTHTMIDTALAKTTLLLEATNIFQSFCYWFGHYL